MRRIVPPAVCVLFLCAAPALAEDFPKPYDPGCTERQNVFEFTQKPAVKLVGKDKYEITFAVKGYCDVTADMIDADGNVVRHIGAGVLGKNAPKPFQKDSLSQKIHWLGKDDLGTYVKEPEKLRARVRLGLKPEFDKRLGGASPYNLPGYVWGMAVGPDGAYVFSKGGGSHGSVGARAFGLDGKYIRTLSPPPANLPHDKLGGYGYVEYEKGKFAIHGVSVNATVANDPHVLPGVNGKGIASCQIALVGKRLYFTNSGGNLLAGRNPSMMYYIHTDGGSTVQGLLEGFPFYQGGHLNTRLAASPNNKWIYGVGVGNCVIRCAVDGKEKGKPFIGDPGKPGSDNTHLNAPANVDCDGKGNIYVCDTSNNRIQVFSPDGKYLKTLGVERPDLVRVHQKTGALYIKHKARIQGKTIDRISKFSGLPDLKKEFHMDNYPAGLMCIDSWSAKTRLWLAGDTWTSNTAGAYGGGPRVTIWEEQGKTFKKILDFDEEGRKEAGENYFGRWSGVGTFGGKTTCDPTREIVYYNRVMYDLKTGKRIGRLKLDRVDDICFDKRGYLHAHFNPGFYMPGVGRLDPSRPQKHADKDGNETVSYPEVPYDYGIQKTGPWNQEWTGVLPVKDQRGAKFFQDGIGCNMRGDVAIESNIYYVPKMEDHGIALARAGVNAQLAKGMYYDGNQAARWERHIEGLKKRGEAIYFIKRRPGTPVAGGTVWTFESSGEMLKECAVIGGDIVNGVQIDEDRAVYLVNARPRAVPSNKAFFRGGKAGNFGTDKKSNPFTGTLIKTKPDTLCRVLMARAVVPLEPVPNRPPDVKVLDWPNSAAEFGATANGWIEGHEWLYAGASPITHVGCSCPCQRLHLDWYKRSFVPEAYRQGIGVLDTAGNLITHIGQYGNFDSATGAKSMVPPGGDGIGIFVARVISGTDSYLAFDCGGMWLMVVKLNYHAEAVAPIAN